MPSEAATPVVIAIDGPAGSGKTTLASALAAAYDVSVVAMDLLDDGWDGLAAGVAQAEAIIVALRAGQTAAYRRFDWNRDCYVETVQVAPRPIVIIEGVGSAATSHRADHVIWIDAPADVRRARAEARGDFGDRWDAWAAQERDLFTRSQAHERADLVLSTDGVDLLPRVIATGWLDAAADQAVASSATRRR